ncbi:MAG TPA: hypothetical protein VKA36_10360 [Solirubrobacterales bacterium]|nr:hypothetical protein [Solirubrobacterales bacterium]
MQNELDRSARSPWPLRAGLAMLAAALLLALAGCGDDADEGTTASSSGAGAAAPTSTNLDPSDTPPTIPDLPDNDDPEMVVCTGAPKPGGDGVFNATAVIGEPLAQAEAAAAKQGCQIRVAMIDGQGQALTEDFRPDRVNVAIEDDEVTEIVSIG